MNRILVLTLKANAQVPPEYEADFLVHHVMVDSPSKAMLELEQREYRLVVVVLNDNVEYCSKVLMLLRDAFAQEIYAVLDESLAEYKYSYMEMVNGCYVLPIESKRLLQAVSESYHTEPRHMKRELYHCRGLTVIPCYYRAFYEVEEMQMSHKEFKLLLMLLKRDGEPIEREELLMAVWGDDYEGATSRTLITHVNRLRSKLAEFTKEEYIETVYKYGYRFLKHSAPVQLRYDGEGKIIGLDEKWRA